LELQRWKSVLTNCYAAVIKFENKEVTSNSYVLWSDGVVETETLEVLRAIVNPVTKELELIREKGLAYFY
jgi:predicted aspartyl protease